MLKNYIKIARPDHWFKNIFMLPGIVLAFEYSGNINLEAVGIKIVLATISICLTASANYVINEWLDAAFDKFHPTKKNRPSITTALKAHWVYAEYTFLVLLGVVLSALISNSFLIVNSIFLLMGILYNVKPFRFKDVPYLDVITESINNPIRFCLGWFVINELSFPPSSILLAYWMGGAFLMGTKRFAEYRFINDPERAGLYRASFNYYDEKRLLISVVFYALLSSFFLGAFLMKHKIELILSFPLFSVLFVWYLSMGFKPNSPVQRPERLYNEKGFILFLVFFAIVTVILVNVQIPFLHILNE